MNPSDPNRPPRPERRFSRLKPAVKRPKRDSTADAEADPAFDDVVDSDPDGEMPPVDAGDAVMADGPAPGDADDGEIAADAEVRAQKPSRPAQAAKATTPAPARQKAEGEARVAKVMARAGVCSRRDAEAWIAAGRVAINGEVITSPARNVLPDDVVLVDGYPIDKPQRTRLFLFHKTRGLVTTAKDPEGRPTVFDALPEDLPRLVTIGRLDINTEGLLLLTNDGGLARLLELPATGWIRRYRVRANGQIDQATLDGLARGLTVEGVTYAGIAAKLDRVQGANVWLTMGLTEGKNREIKRVLEHLGLAVTRLIRISFGPFQLGELAEDGVEEVRTRVLRDQLGTALAKQAGLDFDGPTDVPAPTPDMSGSKKKRKAAEAEAEPPRRQIRRTATADRKGRAVTVERITTVSAAREEQSGRGRPRTLRQADRRAASAAEGEEGARRPSARTGAAMRTPSAAQGDRPMRRRTADAGPEGNRPLRAQRPAGDGATRTERFNSRPSREGFDGADTRPPRRDGAESGARSRSGAPQGRGERFGGQEGGRSRPEGGGRFGGERRDGQGSGAREGGGDRRERFERPQRSERPPRDERRPRDTDQRDERSERPRVPGRGAGKAFGANSSGGKSFGAKSFGDRSFGDRSGAKSFGDRSFGGASRDGASRGASSRGGKPGEGAPRGAGGKPPGRGGPGKSGPGRSGPGKSGSGKGGFGKGGPGRGGSGGGKPRSRG